jgi:hypothetical protein
MHGKPQVGKKPFLPMGLLRTSIGQLVTLSAAKKPRAGGQKEFPDSPEAGDSTNSQGAGKPPPPTAESSGSRL